MILLSFRSVTRLIRRAGAGCALHFHTRLLQYLRALENVRVRCSFPAKSQSCSVRKTQTLDLVLESLKGNATMTISNTQVNPAVLQYTHVTTDLQKENTQNQDWRDCCQAWGSEFIPQNPHCKRTKRTHTSCLLTSIHLLWRVYVHTHTHKK